MKEHPVFSLILLPQQALVPAYEAVTRGMLEQLKATIDQSTADCMH
jgi:hypothetical protein